MKAINYEINIKYFLNSGPSDIFTKDFISLIFSLTFVKGFQILISLVCRFSHGEVVEVEKLEEFKEPDYR